MKGSTHVCSAIGDLRSVVVLDTGALLAGLQLRLPGPSLTTDLVVSEVRDPESTALLERSLEAGKLSVISPNPAYIEEAVRLARSAGTLARLSRADLSVIGAALEIRDCGKEVFVASDDYSVQLTAVAANIGVVPVRYRGVSEARRQGPSGRSTLHQSP